MQTRYSKSITWNLKYWLNRWDYLRKGNWVELPLARPDHVGHVTHDVIIKVSTTANSTFRFHIEYVRRV
jgi:hypothetical protein